MSNSTHPTRRRLPRRAIAIAAALVTATAGVTTFASGGAATAAPSDSGRSAKAPAQRATSERPQLRLEMTEAQTQVFWNRYNACLRDHGTPLYPGRGLSPVQENRPPAAERACASKLPRIPAEIDPDRNPRYRQDFKQEIACLNANGVPVAALPNAAGWNYGDARTARERELVTLEGEAERLEIERACVLKAYGQKR